MKLIAKTLAGLEEVLASELKALNAQKIQVLKRAVSFEGDKALMYRANLELRTALRILMPVKTCFVSNEGQLYNAVQQIDWSQYMGIKDTLAIDATTNSEFFTHSKYVALKSKDAIVDRFRREKGRRPSVDVYNPTLRINIHIFKKECTISLDASGESLHKRGYRVDSVDAPINEVLAAGLIQLSGWKKDRCFIDPMCGSGTILIEAATWACNRPPQLNRTRFGFKKWKDYDQELWEKVQEEAKAKIKPFGYGLYGFDKDFKSRRTAQHNAAAAGLEEIVSIERKPFEKLEAPETEGVIIMNPPYDERLVKDDIEAFYTMIGDRLKQAFSGYDAWVISSNMDALKSIGLRASKKIALFNGALECKFQHYELYSGSKRK